MTDREIQHQVRHQLEQEPRVHATEIGVIVKAGVVSLCGHVESDEERSLAERIARQVPGVRAVANDLDTKQRAIWQ
jgi:osmotically-inducible protein OsmY